MPSHSRGYEGLRGVAIIFVVLHHLQLYGRWRVGPEVFFVLSGLLITRSLAARSEATVTGTLLAFHKRRVVRLLPPLLVMLLGVAAMLRLMPDVDPDAKHVLSAALTYTMNWQQALTSWRSQSLSHLWSLAAEQQFYLLWPPIFLACPRRWLKPLLVALLCVAVGWRFALWNAGAGIGRLFFGLDAHADALVAGCLLACIAVPEAAKPIVRVAGLWALALVTLAALLLQVSSPLLQAVSTTAGMALSAVIVLAVPLGGWLDRILSVRPLRTLGRMSYSLYLWNFPVIAFCHPHWAHGMKAAQLALTAGLSTGTFVWVEKPLIDYLKGRRRAAVLPQAGARVGARGVLVAPSAAAV